MDTQTLPLVPFGKYKGQPITTLLNDTKYLEWCKQQEWFQKFPIVYNICVNQTITSNNQNSKTPEHNKLQNLFLDNQNVHKLLKIIKKNTSNNIHITSGNITFEGMFNWDLIIKDYQWWLCDCDWTHKKNNDTCDCELYKNYRQTHKIPKECQDLIFNDLYCEIKPLLGDDYPCVLRKMNSQIELTNNYATKQNEENDKKLKKEYRENKNYWLSIEEFNYDLYQEHIKPTFLLIIKDFNSTTTTKEQLITIFNQSYIKIIFIDDLFIDYETQSIIERVENPQNQDELIMKNEENKLLRDKLLHADEKIKQLQHELLSFKTNNIKHYFS